MNGRHLSPAHWTSSHTGRRHSTDAGRCTPPRSASHLRRLIGERTREMDRSGPGWALVVGGEIDRAMERDDMLPKQIDTLARLVLRLAGRTP